MKEQNQLPDLLKKWAENAVKIYHQIASRDDVNIAYYTQSDLSLLTTSPELMIVGRSRCGRRLYHPRPGYRSHDRGYRCPRAGQLCHH